MIKARDTLETVSFRKEIPANAREIFTYKIKRDGTTKGLRVRFYQGQVFGLRIVPAIFANGIDHPVPLVMYADNTDGYLSGDDDNITIDRVVSVSSGDIVRIEVNNTNNFSCHLAIDIILDYFGGKERIY